MLDTIFAVPGTMTTPPILPPVSSTVYRLPRSHHHCTLDNFRWPSLAVQQAVRTWMDTVERGAPAHLLATGYEGTGKTHLAAALYRWGVFRWGTGCTVYLEVPAFIARVKARFDAEGSGDMVDPWAEVDAASRLVVLDDLLGRTLTPWELDHVIFRLIQTPYSLGAAVVCTTNYTLDALSTHLRPHELSRLLEGAVHIQFRGADARLVQPCP